MKKSIEILGLPIISITEGRELGISKSLLIDAKQGSVAAITIEDEDWYRGVKLIPYEAIIAIGEDAITITHSENILNLEEAGDYERLLVENIRVIGTKAITKSGRIQGNVTEVYVGESGRIDKCEVTTHDGTINEVTAEQISIFGKQVTVIDVEEKKNELTAQPAFEPAFEAFSEEPPQEVWSPPLKEPAEETFTQEEPVPELTLPPEETPATNPETQAELESVMTADPESEPAAEVVEEPEEVPEEMPVEKPAEVPVTEIVEESATVPVETEEDKKIAAMTRQAEDLKAALKKARENQSEQKPPESQKKQVEKAVDERRRRVLLGKHATKTITAESGTVVVEAGAEVTEEVLQRARLSNKFIELSMNVQ